MAGDTNQDTTVPQPTSPFQYPRVIKGKRSYGVDDQFSYDEGLATNAFFINYGALEAGGGSDVATRAQLRQQISQGQQVVYGQALLDDEGYLIRGKYMEDAETAEQQFLKFSPTDLAALAKQMQRTGFYTTGDPSGLILSGRGYSNTDINAMVNLLRFSNQKGLIVQSVAKMLAGMSAVAGGGTAVKVTADEDIRYYLQQAFFSRMGRAPTKQDIDMAVKAIQDNERKMAASSRSAPSVAVAAKLQAEKANPSEGAAYQLGNAIKLAFSYLSGS
jgi:hypothetical protein